MKKQRTAGAKGRVRGGRRHARSFRTGLAFLAAGLLLFSSGCGASKEAEPESLEPEHIVSVTVVNASDDAVTAILIDWSDTLGAELYDVLETAGIEELKPDDVITVAVPELDEPREITVWNPEYEDIYNEELEKGEGGQGGGKDGVSADGKTIVVFSDDLDRALASFVIADGAASAGRKVTLFFTFWGLNVIKRKATVPVKKDMAGKLFGMMLPSGSRKLALSKLNLGGIGSRMMRGMMKNKKIDSLETLMEQAKANGVEFIACRMSMEVMGIKAEELLDGVKIGGVATYLERAEQANINLFI